MQTPDEVGRSSQYAVTVVKPAEKLEPVQQPATGT